MRALVFIVALLFAGVTQAARPIVVKFDNTGTLVTTKTIDPGVAPLRAPGTPVLTMPPFRWQIRNDLFGARGVGRNYPVEEVYPWSGHFGPQNYPGMIGIGTNGAVPDGQQGWRSTVWNGKADPANGHPADDPSKNCDAGVPIYCYEQGEDGAAGALSTASPFDGGQGTYVMARNGGAVRFFCDFSHFAYDDPLVFPGQAGKSHLHAFFGNTLTGPSTNSATIASQGDSTCSGGTNNRTGYWVPAMIYHCPVGGLPVGCNPLLDGTPIRPHFLNAYYKANFGFGHVPGRDGSDQWIFHHDVQPFPAGFRMIAGVPTASPASPATPTTGVPSYSCRVGGADFVSDGVAIPGTGAAPLTRPPCPSSTDIFIQGVNFPACWNGVDLDSPGHNAHMNGNIIGGACPAGFLTPVPGIAYLVEYAMTGVAPYRPQDIQFWRLSSDNYDDSLPAGYSGHGDWMMGWDPTIMAQWVSFCLNKGLECSDDFIGVVVPNQNPPLSGYRVLSQPYRFRAEHQ